MRMIALFALIASLLAVPAQAGIVTVDFGAQNWQAVENQGVAGRLAGNTFRLENIGLGSTVTAASWSNLQVSVASGNVLTTWTTDLTLFLGDSTGVANVNNFWRATPDPSGAASATFTGSGSFVAGGGNGGPFTVLPDGILLIEAASNFGSNGSPINITGGTLTVTFSAIPEPSSALLVVGAIGGLALRRRRRIG